jgi:hypothetical protein
MALRPSTIAGCLGAGLIGAGIVLAGFTASAGAAAPKPAPRAPSSAPVGTVSPTATGTPPRPVPTVAPSRSGSYAPPAPPRSSVAPIAVPAGGGPAATGSDGPSIGAITLLASGAVLIGGGAVTAVRRRS